REPDRLLLGLEPRDARHRAERLLRADQHVGRDTLEHRRRVEVPARVLALGQAFAADDEPGAALDRVADVLVGLVDAALVDQRPDLDTRLVAGADGHLRDLLGDARDDLVVDAALDVGAVGADARLAG